MFNLKFLSPMERQMPTLNQFILSTGSFLNLLDPGAIYMGLKYVVRTCLPTRGNGNPGPRGSGFARLGPRLTWLLLGLGLAVESPWSEVSTGWAISFLLCTNGLRRRSSGHVEPPFLAVRLFSRSVEVTMYHWHWHSAR